MSPGQPFVAAVIGCGRHARIPECCIAAFVADMATGRVDIARARWIEMGLVWGSCPGWLDYVPCPDCFAEILSGTSPAAIHICDDASAQCRRIQASYDRAHDACRRAA